MKTIICSQILPNNIKNNLSSAGFTLVEGSYSTIIENETKYHPDMLYFKMLSNKLLVSDKINFVHNLDTFKIVEKTRTPQGAKYPKDCVLNCFRAKNHLFCGGYVAEEIVDECKRSKIEIIKVKQGYAACSTVKVTDEAFITSDTGIHCALIKHGYDALLVSNEGIKLNGYSNGFIGGCALVTENMVAFTGNIKKHKDYENIKAFTANYNKTIVNLNTDTLYDYGGFILL